MVVVADDENLDLAQEHGFVGLDVANDQLGKKWNDGIEFACRDLDADLVAVVGSDDWVHPDVFDVIPRAFIPEPEPDDGVAVIWDPDGVHEAVTGREITLVDLATSRMRCCVPRGRFGVIPFVFPRSALERCSFRPLPDGASYGLDGLMIAGLGHRPSWIFHDPHPLARVDFKSSVNLNTYDQITRSVGAGPEVLEPWDALAELYPIEIVDMARELSADLAVAA